ncbi:hypothetical protein QTP70_022943 [Hemibagrus guttatus]|uniref:Nuclear body protein SP140-like protein n=1 Tax=Hemibagrus guttatus TaxID=175788 RepID=A0AAE0UKT3_9TELE|nr:hypothetical protein QTP70_022943 [Hemibagrus guttatus]
MLQKYPFLCSLMTSLLEDFVKVHGQPDAKKVTGSEKKKGRNKRKRCTDESEEEEEEPHTSSVSRSSQRRADVKPRMSPMKEEEPEDIWISDCSKTLSVTCGDKEGTLYGDKLARGEECILSEDEWFTPHEFERFSGKGNSKNWKQSIRYQNTPLQKLIKLEEEDIKQEEEEEDDSEPADLSKFQDFALPVSCGSVSGSLYKSRFAGPRSKSIRTEEHWFTPEEFVKKEITLTDGHWKKDILCQGKTLHYLVKKKILYIHSLLCYCRLCRPENQHCEYLLLRLYKEDTRCVFTDDPTTTVEKYNSMISKPMWLNRVKTKLQNKEYKIMAEFVNDIILIFNNCKIFNKDNEFGKMGERLSKLFAEDLYTVFNIQ